MKSKSYQELSRRLRKLSKLAIKTLRQDIEAKLKQENIEISYLGFKVVKEMGAGELTLKELSQRLVMAPASLVPIVDRLVKKGLAERKTDPKDRRSNIICLTQKGKKAYAITSSACNENVLLRSFSNLGPKKAAMLVDLFEELVTNMGGEDMKVRVAGIHDACCESKKDAT